MTISNTNYREIDGELLASIFGPLTTELASFEGTSIEAHFKFLLSDEFFSLSSNLDIPDNMDLINIATRHE